MSSLQLLYDYHYWANQRLLGAVSRLTPAQFTQDVAGSYGSVRNTLVHVLSAEWGWLDRCGGPRRGEKLKPEDYPTVESVVRAWTLVEQHMRGFLTGLSDDDLARDVEFSLGEGPAHLVPLAGLLQHAAIHAVHHRGQVALLLRALGCVPGNFDLLFYLAAKQRGRSTTAHGTRKPGEFCWINILTPEPDRAREFFSAVLGWTYGDIPGLGHSIKVGGRDIGGIFSNVGPNSPSGGRPVIGVMVKVESADATAEKIRANGGTAMEPFDVGEGGRMAVCHDPNGAQIDLWQARKGAGTDVDTTLPGAPCWFETLTTDPDRAARFYASVFGWTTEIMPTAEVTYTNFRLGSTLVGGMMQLTPDMHALRPHWGVYFTVTDPDAALRRAADLGATIDVPARDIPGVGRFGGVTSPQGVVFYVIRHLSPEMAR